MTHGPQAYDELLAMEGKIRKQRQETIYKQQKLRQQMLEVVGWVVLAVISGLFIAVIVNVWIKRADADTHPKTFIVREEPIND